MLLDPSKEENQGYPKYNSNGNKHKKHTFFADWMKKYPVQSQQVADADSNVFFFKIHHKSKTGGLRI